MVSVILSKHISLWMHRLRVDGKHFLCKNLTDKTAADFHSHFPTGLRYNFLNNALKSYI